MLHDFVTSNREELINRCRGKVAKRFANTKPASAIGQGVPLFLRQLVYVLLEEQSAHFPPSGSDRERSAPSASSIGRTAASHGAELLSLGYTIGQVVHEYGDVCQSVTELAIEKNAPISTDEFRILNRCLDNAIADAVESYGLALQTSRSWQAIALKDRMKTFGNEYRRLVDVASQAFAAIQTGGIGLSGATGSLLAHTLTEMRYLAEQGIPEMPLQSVTSSSNVANG